MEKCKDNTVQNAASGCKEHAFDVLGENKVHAIIQSDNTASQKVTERIGIFNIPCS